MVHKKLVLMVWRIVYNSSLWCGFRELRLVRFSSSKKTLSSFASQSNKLYVYLLVYYHLDMLNSLCHILTMVGTL